MFHNCKFQTTDTYDQIHLNYKQNIFIIEITITS